MASRLIKSADNIRYSSNGAQINRPEDGEIAQSIKENLEPWPNAWDKLQPGEYLRADSYQKLLPHYNKKVEEFTVRHLLKVFEEAKLIRHRNPPYQTGRHLDLSSIRPYMGWGVLCFRISATLLESQLAILYLWLLKKSQIQTSPL